LVLFGGRERDITMYVGKMNINPFKIQSSHISYPLFSLCFVLMQPDFQDVFLLAYLIKIEMKCSQKTKKMVVMDGVT
jgi:hypothetical protein